MSAIDRLNRRGGAFVSDLREAAIQNPAAALLIGAGAAWLLASRTPIGTMAASGGARLASVAGGAQRAAADAAQTTWETASGAAGDLGDRVADLGGSVRNAAAAAGANVTNMVSGAARTVASAYEEPEHSASDRLPGAAGDALDHQAASLRDGLNEGLHSGAERLASARARLSDLFDRQPLALGVFGLAVGAALAGALPATDFENELLGETSDLRRKVMRQADRARDTASAIAEKAVEEAKAQNLTPESLRDDVAAAAVKAGGVAKSAGETLRQSAQGPTTSQANVPTPRERS